MDEVSSEEHWNKETKTPAVVDVNRIISDLSNLVFILSEKTGNSSLTEAVNGGRRTLESLHARNGHSSHSLSRGVMIDNKNYTIDTNGRVKIVKPNCDNNRNRELGAKLLLERENNELRALQTDLMSGLELIMRKHRIFVSQHAKKLRTSRANVDCDQVQRVQKDIDEKVTQRFAETSAALDFLMEKETEKEEMKEKQMKRIERENFLMRLLLSKEEVNDGTVDDLVAEFRKYKGLNDSDVSMNETVLRNDSKDESFA